MVPGDFANQVWLTAATCSRLVLHSRQASVRFDAALDFLRAAWDGERFPKYNHTHWVSLVVFGLMKDPAAVDRDIFAGSVRLLEDALAEDRIDPLEVIDVARDALYAGRPGARLFEAALPKLLAGQADDGGWTTGYGDQHRPTGTAEAVHVLKLAAARGLLADRERPEGGGAETMPELTRVQVNEFLATPVIARLATVQPDGAPYVVPVWQHWDGEAMYVIPRGRSRFVEHIRAEPRVAVSCADDVGAAHRRVLIEGRAEIVEGPVPMAGRTLDIAREMAERYGGEAGLRYLEGTMDKPRYLLRIVPDTLTTWEGGWHPRYG